VEAAAGVERQWGPPEAGGGVGGALRPRRDRSR